MTTEQKIKELKDLINLTVELSEQAVLKAKELTESVERIIKNLNEEN